jgi:hypothetical protein
VLQLFPIWSLQYFPTLDAAGHIYNGKIIWQMWYGNAELFNSHYQINYQLNPNWLSQLLLTFLTPLFQPHVCEKIILSSYVIGFSVAFRMLVSAFQATKLLAFLIFFFIYNSTFIYGFLNYNFGLVFLLLCVYLLKHYLTKSSLKLVLWLSVSSLLLFFSHLVTFGVFGIAAIVLVAQQFYIEQKNQLPHLLFKPRVILELSSALILPAILLLQYLLNDNESANYSSLPPQEIRKNLTLLSGNFCYSIQEFAFTRWIWIITLSGLLISFSIFWTRKKQTLLKEVISFTSLSLFSFAMSVILLVMCFVLPDSSAGGGGALTLRLVFLTTFFFSLFQFSMFQNTILLAAMLVAINIVAIDKLFYVKNEQEQKQEYCATMNDASQYIDENSAMLFFDFSRTWPLNHTPKYIATKRNLILTDNLGAHKLFSPVQWRSGLRLNNWMLGATENEWHCNLEMVESTLNKKIDYFLVAGDCEQVEGSAPICQKWKEFFSDSCNVAYKGKPSIILYKRIKNI